MSQPPKSITLDEQAARRVVLAQAIESSDSLGKLMSRAEREEIDRLVAQSARKDSPAMTAEELLEQRARDVLRVVESRNPALASLQTPRLSARWFAVAAFLAAVFFGAATDRIANPHRIDLLSLPLLAIIAWNVLIYCALIAGYFVHRQRHAGARPTSALFIRWADGWQAWRRRAGQLRANATAVFMRNWHRATAALNAQRFRKILHLAAAGWALGIALSLFTRGLVVEYRVGWESTFLDAAQVHAILRVLLMPAMALFPFQAFSVQDIAGLRFGSGNGAMAGARWVYIYATLLAVVVIVPRLALASYAGWRERLLASRVPFDPADPYFQRLVAMLNPTRVQLGLFALRDDDRQALLHVLQRPGRKLDADATAGGSLLTLIDNSDGEALCLANLSAASRPLPPAASLPPDNWASRLLNRLPGVSGAGPQRTLADPGQAAFDASDVVLFVARGAKDLDASTPLFNSLAKPVLLLTNSPDSEERQAVTRLWLAAASASGLQTEALGFDRFARCWVQEPVFLDCLARCMPAAKKAACARLADAWLKGNDALFAESMRLVALQLQDAAREVEEVPGALPYFKRLTSLNDRQADAQARQDAIAAVAGRLQRSAQATHAELLRLHGIVDASGMPLEQALKAKFDFQAPINAGEAGLAGAATGAASGASIDLVTGGLTLGMATALGALIGGGAALAGAAWKNRATPAGKTLVQLSDEMLQAMAAASLLRYLAIADFGRGAGANQPETAAMWERTVLAALEPKKETLARFWALARARQGQAQSADALGGELQIITRSVLGEVYLEGRSS